jgi:endonuclease YncB( thermonuclease family)
MKPRRALLAIFLLVQSTFAAEQTLSNCTWIAHRNNDGDSFHVQWGDSNILVRLNFIDTPEATFVYGDRLPDQAKYFRITTPDAVKIGQAAKAFTESTLASNSFAVVTRGPNPAGYAAAHLVYASVRVGETDLAELLVSNGLARIVGPTAPETLTAKLKALEADAQANQRGAWALSSTNSLETLAETGYRISASGVRHNAKCKYYNSKNAQPCRPTDGTACKVCGG